jgi:hypothetical protein
MRTLARVTVACFLLILGRIAPASAAAPASKAAPPASNPRESSTPGRPAAVPAPPTTKDLDDLDRDDAAAEAAADRGDFSAALRYMDFFGHEQEEFATAMLEFGRDQRKLRKAVVDSIGDRAWRHAAAALGVPHHRPRGEERSVRREGEVVYVRNGGAEFESPYVKVGGVWKVSVRDILLTAIRARFGPKEKVEEADLHVLAGKMAKVIRGRSKGLSDLAEAVRTGRIRTDAALREAAENLRRAPARPKE